MAYNTDLKDDLVLIVYPPSCTTNMDYIIVNPVNMDEFPLMYEYRLKKNHTEVLTFTDFYEFDLKNLFDSINLDYLTNLLILPYFLLA